MHDDETKEFLDNLPELGEGKTYKFKCYPGISCFNECCSDLNLVMPPYDVLRMRQGLDNRPSNEFLSAYCDIHAAEDTNLPVVQLRMSDNIKRSCPFVRKDGCSVYENRPGACRMYPLGRACRPDGKGGVTEQFFVVQEDHCNGFQESTEWTSEQWMEGQGFEPYAEGSDRYMQFMTKCRHRDQPLSDKLAKMILLAFYQPDQFQGFIQAMKIFERVEVDEDRQKRILEDEEACLDFAMDWMELLLFHESDTLKPKR